jgi:hypothetical protein
MLKLVTFDDEADAFSEFPFLAAARPPPRATNVQFRTAGIFTADFDEATQCGQNFVPSWGPW